MADKVLELLEKALHELELAGQQYSNPHAVLSKEIARRKAKRPTPNQLLEGKK